ncbi:Uncharacterized protein OBRU01_05405 [Operophtera brumata]|uniref:SAM domain-containing protein n=1 Tax=Operophtera brumata TaxID=104452 RepID=A0A0L7LN01_OPEBR|nr:Uncharacterized protein OBRU01_05405 [Operophtera brumata]
MVDEQVSVGARVEDTDSEAADPLITPATSVLDRPDFDPRPVPPERHDDNKENQANGKLESPVKWNQNGSDSGTYAEIGTGANSNTSERNILDPGDSSEEEVPLPDATSPGRSSDGPEPRADITASLDGGAASPSGRSDRSRTEEVPASPGMLSAAQLARRLRMENERLQAELTRVRRLLVAAAERALKADKKRLKAEKFDLLSQMKQLYATLEDKEKELRDFIRNYEQMRSRGGASSALGAERAERERERAALLRSSDGGATSVCGGNLSDSTAEGVPPTVDAYDTDATSLVSSAHHIYQLSTPRDCSPPTLSPHNSASPFTRSIDAGSLSRSVEQLSSPGECEAALVAGLRGRAGGGSKGARGRGSAWGSISRVFARSRHRTNEAALREAASLPLARWRAPAIIAWLELALGMPQYAAAVADNVKSGKIRALNGQVLLELSDADLEAGLGVAQPMHRKKLRLAIEERRRPDLVRNPTIGQLTHAWVAAEWLPDLGLSQYTDSFLANLVDARMLDTISKKELEKYLGVTRKFHQASIVHGIHLLRIMKYDRQALAVRRHQCENVDADPLVWTNQRFMRWAHNIDLGEFADNLKGICLDIKSGCWEDRFRDLSLQDYRGSISRALGALKPKHERTSPSSSSESSSVLSLTTPYQLSYSPPIAVRYGQRSDHAHRVSSPLPAKSVDDTAIKQKRHRRVKSIGDINACSNTSV